jgi:hypothetical protein
MLFRESLTVAPLNPVDVGDDWFLCDDDLEGTWRRLRPFLGFVPSSGDNKSLSLAISVSAGEFWGWISSAGLTGWGLSDMFAITLRRSQQLWRLEIVP